VGVRGFRRYATYRAATFAGVFTNSVWGFIRAYIMLALFDLRPHIGGFDVRDVLTYTFVTQGFLMPMAMFGWSEIEDRIRTGDVVTDLYRPVDFQLYWLSQDAGRALFQTLFRGIPPVLVGALFFTLRLPSVGDAALFVVSCCLGLLVSFGIRFLVNLTAFWLLDARGLNQLATMLNLALGGVAVPIVLFPHAFEVVARALPFASMAQIPLEVYLGKHHGADALGMLALQAGWAVFLLGAGRVVLARATRKVVVQGG
jgi:ABC-2 type transport system permease protein